jgi:chromate transporter
MSLGLLYLLLLKATVTSFSGLGSLPQIRQDFVVTHQVLDDDELSRAVLIGRSTPGAIGAFVVSIGYSARGWPGAIVGWIALISPSSLALVLLAVVRRWLHLSRMRSAIDAVVLAGAVLLIPAAFQLARDGIAQMASLVLRP